MGSSEGAMGVQIVTRDRASGDLALASTLSGITVVDPETGESTLLAEADFANNLGFGRNGEYLAVTGADGTVRLWDLERNEPAGLLWNGTGATISSPSWYDAESDSMWVYTSGKILEIPLDPAVWIARACTAAGRELTPEEWSRLVPGDTPPTPACP